MSKVIHASATLHVDAPKVGQEVLYRNHTTNAGIVVLEIGEVRKNFFSAHLPGHPGVLKVTFHRLSGVDLQTPTLSATNCAEAIAEFRASKDAEFNAAFSKTSRRDAGTTRRKSV